jgi:hypothetical protein
MTIKIRFFISLTCFALFISFVIISSPPREVTIYVAPAGTHLDTATIYKPEFEKVGIKLNIEKVSDIVNVKSHVGKEDGAPTMGFAGTSLTAGEFPNVRAAGVTGLMPLFVFVKNSFLSNNVSNLLGEKICLPPKQSITSLMALKVLEAYGINENNSNIQFSSLNDWVSELKNGQCEAGIIILAPDSSIISELKKNKDLKILNFVDSRALTAKVENTEQVVIPLGAFDTINQLPKNDLNLLGIPNTVIFREDLDPEIIYSLLKIMKVSHAKASMVSSAYEYPKQSQQLLIEDDTVKGYYESGVPWTTQIFPYWIASLFNKYTGLIIFLVTANVAIEIVILYFIWVKYLVKSLKKRES